MLIRTHVGVSPDGFVAIPDGLPTWDSLPTFVPGESHADPDFVERCGAIVMGRSCFDQGFEVEIATFSNEVWAASQTSPSGADTRSLLRLGRQRGFPDGAVELVFPRRESREIPD